MVANDNAGNLTPRREQARSYRGFVVSSGSAIALVMLTHLRRRQLLQLAQQVMGQLAQAMLLEQLFLQVLSLIHI